MADKNVSDPPTIIPKTTKPASEALLNEKVRFDLNAKVEHGRKLPARHCSSGEKRRKVRRSTC